MVRIVPPPRTKQLIKIAAPCVIEQFLLVLVGLISTAIIGHLGKTELTASSMSNTLVNCLQCFYTGLTAGATVVIGRLWGENDKDGVRRAFFQALVLTAFVSFAVLAFLLIFQSQIILLLFGKAEGDVMKNIHIYFPYCMIGMPATALTNAISASLRGTGDNKTALVTSVFLNALNVVLSYILIYGIEPLHIPQMGIRGAAIAVCSARYSALIFSFIYIYAKKAPVLPKSLKYKPDFTIIKRICSIGIPSAVEQLVFQSGFLILQTLLLTFGTVLQAGYQIGSQVNGLNNAPAMALSVAMTSLISQQIGKRDYEAALEYLKAAKYLVWTFFTAMCVVMLALSPLQARLYTSDPDVITSATFFIILFASTVIPVGFMQTMAGVLRGAGDAKYVAVSGIVGLWFFRIFLVWLISKYTNGYIGVAIGLPADFLARSFMYNARVRKGNWLHIHV